MKEIIGKLNFIKIKSVCSAKNDVKRMKRQAIKWKKISAKDKSDTGVLFKIYNEHFKFNTKKKNNPI